MTPGRKWKPGKHPAGDAGVSKTGVGGPMRTKKHYSALTKEVLLTSYAGHDAKRNKLATTR